MTGIYLIVNKVNNKVYVGSSKSSVHRKKKHIYYLRKGEHKNKHLQSSWNKYGESKFIFSFLEEVSNKKERIKREQIYIDAYMSCNPKYGYNKCSANCAILSEESRKKISNAVSKLNMEQAEEIRKKYNTGNYSQGRLSKEYKVGKHTIRMIIKNIYWRE